MKGGTVTEGDAVANSSPGDVCGIMNSGPPGPPGPPPPPPPPPPAGLIDLGACSNPPCFRIKNQCNFQTYLYGLGGCCGAFGKATPVPNDGQIHEFPMGCNGHGRIAFGPDDPNINGWYAGEQVYSLIEPGPDGNCGSMNYDSSYIDTGILMPLGVRAKPCNTQSECKVSYDALNKSAPAQWVKYYGSQSYFLSYARYCTEYNTCDDLRATAKKLSQAIGACADSAVDSRPIAQIAGCGGGPWSASSSCCSAVNFGLVDYIINNNKWSAWDSGSDCATFYQYKYTSAFNHYQQWIENVCQVKYQYGFPYADHCGWSSDIGCSNSHQMDILVCPQG